jgi:hypothetical protein
LNSREHLQLNNKQDGINSFSWGLYADRVIQRLIFRLLKRIFLFQQGKRKMQRPQNLQ